MHHDPLPDPALANQPDAEFGDEVASFHRLLHQAHRRFGEARIEMGALLEVIRSKALWRGRALSFTAYLEDERINETSAYQYMRVAKRFFYELRLSQSEIDEISMVGMRLLDQAAKIITKDNKDEIIAMLVCLGERDARAALAEYAEGNPAPELVLPENRRPKMSAPVAKLYREIRSLPDDQKIELVTALHA